MVNQYPAFCKVCNGQVPAKGGILKKAGRRFTVTHLACEAAGKPAVNNFYSPVTGNSWTQNVNGRCIDYPACGCCS